MLQRNRLSLCVALLCVLKVEAVEAQLTQSGVAGIVAGSVCLLLIALIPICVACKKKKVEKNGKCYFS